MRLSCYSVLAAHGLERFASGQSRGYILRVQQTAGASLPYVEQRDGTYRVSDSRVSLDSIVHAFWSGQTPERIAQSFPTLALEQVYGAIAFYLAQRAELDRYLVRGKAEFETARDGTRVKDPIFHAKLAAIKRLGRFDSRRTPI
jgi:uncharacterized protein (DUF433 family)